MEFNSRVNQLIVTINQSTIVSDNDGKAVYLSSIVSFHESNLGFVCLFALRARILYYGSVAAAAFLLSQVSDVAATILLKPGSYLVYESILVWPILSTILWLQQSRQDPPPPQHTLTHSHADKLNLRVNCTQHKPRMIACFHRLTHRCHSCALLHKTAWTERKKKK